MGVVSLLTSALETKPGGRKIETGHVELGPGLIRAEEDHQTE
jgi:hypothetical protein